MTKTTPLTFWLCGLSGAGKTTLAKALSGRLKGKAHSVCILDGDQLRSGLCNDLGFSVEAREENVRRAAEVAHLLNNQGITVICALISPTQQGRQQAKTIIGIEKYVEVYVSTPLNICLQRDPKGLYKKSLISNSIQMSGIGSVFEPPVNPHYSIDTSLTTIQEALDEILAAI